MRTPTRRRKNLESAAADTRYSELRTELEGELRRLAPGADVSDPEALRGLSPQSRRRALQILEVLRRMEGQGFGVCASCRSSISYERLAVSPETTVCADCSWGRLSLQG